MEKTKTIFAILMMLTLLSCKPDRKAETRLPVFNTPDFTPTWIEPDAPEYTALHTIPPFSFTDQNGKSVSEKSVAGKIYVVDFFFTRCQSICPKMTTNMGKVATEFMNDRQVMMLSHSVTPELDNTAVLKAYAREKKVTNPNWHLLTGDKKEIYDIARKSYFADNEIGYNKDFNQFLHTENFVLVDRHRHIRGVYNGTIDFEIDNLVRHIRLLEQEVQ